VQAGLEQSRRELLQITDTPGHPCFAQGMQQNYVTNGSFYEVLYTTKYTKLTLSEYYKSIMIVLHKHYKCHL
jgi:hypothetical protein